MTRFRFGVNFRSADIDAWPDFCRGVEEQGYDVVLAPDHLGAPSPFAMLAAAAVATSRLRLGTYVVNNEFWNPALLAREAATVDRLSGGRLELGLGAGHTKSEFTRAGLEWREHPERVERLERSIAELDRFFAEDGQQPLPRQVPRPPLLIGGHGERTLRVAARHADIIGFTGLTQIRGRRLGTFRVAGVEETLRRVDLVRRAAGNRADHLEFGALIQAVVVTDDAEREAAELIESFSEAGVGSVRELLDNPFVLLGTPEEIAALIVARREAYGFTYLATHGPFRDDLAQAIPLVRERQAAA